MCSPSIRCLAGCTSSASPDRFRCEVRGKAVSAIATAWFGHNAHVVAVDPATHAAYFPLKAVKSKPMLRITRPQT